MNCNCGAGLVERVVNGTKDTNRVTFRNKRTGELLDYSLVTRMLLSFEGTDIVADSLIDPALIDFSSLVNRDPGEVIFSLAGLGIPETEEPRGATLLVFDITSASRPQSFTCKDDDELSFHFKDC